MKAILALLGLFTITVVHSQAFVQAQISTSNTDDNISPKISNGHVTWSAITASTRQIFLYDGNTISLVSTGTSTENNAPTYRWRNHRMARE